MSYSDQINNSDIRDTLHDNWVDEQERKLETERKAKSGFFDLPNKKYCSHPEHEPPKHICIPAGKGYKHVCPRCGNEHIIIPQQVTF